MKTNETKGGSVPPKQFPLEAFKPRFVSSFFNRKFVQNDFYSSAHLSCKQKDINGRETQSKRNSSI